MGEVQGWWDICETMVTPLVASRWREGIPGNGIPVLTQELRGARVIAAIVQHGAPGPLLAAEGGRNYSFLLAGHHLSRTTLG